MSKHDMVGSMHKYSDGYGYGARMITARNSPTLPRSIPKQQRPPDSERFIMQTKPKPLPRADDEKGMKRNAEAIVYQTSGEYGLFLVDTESTVEKLNRTGIIPAMTLRQGSIKPSSARMSARIQDVADNIALWNGTPSAVYSNHSNHLTQPIQINDSRTEHRKPYSNLNQSQNYADHALAISQGNLKSSGIVDPHTKMRETLQNLDKNFNKNNKNDLQAVLNSEKPLALRQELGWAVARNNRGQEYSKNWAYRLRNDSTN
eukprot:gene11341-15206_t